MGIPYDGKEIVGELKASLRTKHFQRRSGMVRQHQTRNLEIPGSMLAHRPGMTVPSSSSSQRR
jgi:hypothetical protein